MELHDNNPGWKEYRRGSLLPAILILLLLGSIAMNIYQHYNHNADEVRYETRMDSVVTQRVNIEKELGLTSGELDKYKGISDNLDSIVNEGNKRIADQEEKIRELVKAQGNSTARNKKLEKELAELKRLKEEYLERIDQLLTENQELKDKTRKLDSTVTALTVQRRSLEKKIAAAAVPRTAEITVKSLKRRNNGKFAETSLAKKANRLNVCFYMLDGKISEPGEKTVFIRIITPDEKVIGNRSTGSNSFMEAETNKELLYTIRKTIDYNNERLEVCTGYEEEKGGQLPAGQYTVEVYIDGYLTSSAAFTLR
jgi:TolA-binding protein